MSGEKQLDRLLKKMKPTLNEGDYVFCTVKDLKELHFNDIIFTFKEQEGITIVLQQEIADRMQLEYSFVTKWITLTVHSSLRSSRPDCRIFKSVGGRKYQLQRCGWLLSRPYFYYQTRRAESIDRFK